MPNHFTIFFSAAKGRIYYVAIAVVIFSHVKVTCYFHVWRYHVSGIPLVINFFISENIDAPSKEGFWFEPCLTTLEIPNYT